MIAAALLLSSAAVASSSCSGLAVLRSPDTSELRVQHAFQNGKRVPLQLSWIDSQGKHVDLGTIAPGAYISLQTFVGHAFVLTDPSGRCQNAVRIGNVFSGTYVGTSRYRPVALRQGWHVLVDQTLNPTTEPARTALGTLAQLLQQADAALPPASLAQVRMTPIFLHHNAGSGGMYHPHPGWLVAHGRTVEMLNGSELSDAAVFVETVKTKPGAVLHELAHAYYMRLSDDDRAEIDAVYRRAMESGRYRKMKRHDGVVADAYASHSAVEYFAELSENYFSRKEFFRSHELISLLTIRTANA